MLKLNKHLRTYSLVLLSLLATIIANAQTVATNNPSVCGLGLTINDLSCTGTPLNVNINVNGLAGMSLGSDIFLKEVKLIIQHDWVADLEFTLHSPSGVSVLLSADNGGSGDNYGQLNLACDATTTFISNQYADFCNTTVINNALAPFIGTYLPQGNLSDFNDGTNPNGNWIFEICDDGAFNIGTLEYLELVFDAGICNAPTNLQAATVNANNAIITWDVGSGNTSQTYIEFGETATNFSPGNDANAGSSLW